MGRRTPKGQKKKKHKRIIKIVNTTFQVFWSHATALCEEKSLTAMVTTHFHCKKKSRLDVLPKISTF